MEKYIAIGDIHGCFSQLMEILEKAKEYPDHKLIFLGDYIDRGPDSEKVINTIRELDAIFLKGNHEEMLLSRLEKSQEDESRILEIAKISRRSVNWIMKSLSSIYETEDYIFVHAGLNINATMEDQTERDFFWTIHDGDYYTLTNKYVIHGHVIKEELEEVGNRININTGCGSGGKLTGLILPEKKYIFSSKSAGNEYNWEYIRKELEAEIEELEES